MSQEPVAFTRREMLHAGLALASTAVFTPSFVQRSGSLLPTASAGLSSIPGVDEGRILLVVQLSGGNDGLNTIAPVGRDEYHRARPRIGLSSRDALALPGSDGLGLHPALAPFRDMYDDGMVSIVQGVGYPNPNRSHFKSMDIWHTADMNGRGRGWLGRYFDAQCDGQGHHDGESISPGISIGEEAPLAMQGERVMPIAFESSDTFRWTGDRDDQLAAAAQRVLKSDREHLSPAAAFLSRTALDARVSSETLRRAVESEPETEFPGNPIGRQLQTISSMIRADLPTRVYYATHGGFDTHAGQGGAQGQHARLLGQFADSMRAFYREMDRIGASDRVLTLVFSEFGRRVAQNASGGTDHGTAAPVFLMGPMVKPGVFGDHPSLRDLDDGDLKHSIDFRSVYAGVLERWLDADSRAVLGKRFRPITTIRS
ncbi:MAG: DUF1501 domain-containing protein [Planctomycetota bacterium]